MSAESQTLPRDTVIMMRERTFVNTAPYFSGHYAWTAWAALEYVPAERAERRVEFWKELNDIAVKGRGEGALREFRLAPAQEGVQ